MRFVLLLVAFSFLAALTVVGTPAANAAPVCFSVGGTNYCCPEPPMCGPRQMCTDIVYFWEGCYVQAAEHIVGPVIL